VLAESNRSQNGATGVVVDKIGAEDSGRVIIVLGPTMLVVRTMLAVVTVVRTMLAVVTVVPTMVPEVVVARVMRA